MQWDASPLAARYRARTMIVGAQTAYVLAASTTEPIIVQAVNSGLQGVASDPIQFTLLLPAVSTSPEPVTVPELAAIPAGQRTNGNGSNGHVPASGA